MILGPISLLDCLAFVLILIPQLLYQADIFSLLVVILKVIPFLSKHGWPLTIRETNLVDAVPSLPVAISIDT